MAPKSIPTHCNLNQLWTSGTLSPSAPEPLSSKLFADADPINSICARDMVIPPHLKSQAKLGYRRSGVLLSLSGLLQISSSDVAKSHRYRGISYHRVATAFATIIFERTRHFTTGQDRHVTLHPSFSYGVWLYCNSLAKNLMVLYIPVSVFRPSMR